MKNSLFTAGRPVTYQRHTNNEFVPAQLLGPSTQGERRIRIGAFALCISAIVMDKSMMPLWIVSRSPNNHLHPQTGTFTASP